MMKMKKIKYILVVVAIGIFFSPYHSMAENENDDFDFILALTQQDLEMDWWYFVPAQFTPNVSRISEVVKGEYFKILPIFNNYGKTSENTVNVTYDLEMLKPDGSVYHSQKSIPGFQGQTPGPYLLPSQKMIMVSFEPEDPFGEYTINIKAFDHTKNQNQNKSQKITLNRFRFNELEGSLEDWFLKYPIRPRPSYALSAFINTTRPYLDDKGQPLWSALWLYKHIYDENKFLIPHTVEFFKTKSSQQQQKDIILLFYLLNSIETLPIGTDFKEYVSALEQINIPAPYQEITSGDQLDMLWAEFFATSRIKPIRQIITSLNLGQYHGTLKKIESKELEITKDVEQKAYLEAVFRSALWSIKSNCEQSPLVYQYCVSLYLSDELNKIEGGLLGAILKKISEKKKAESNHASSPDTKNSAPD